MTANGVGGRESMGALGSVTVGPPDPRTVRVVAVVQECAATPASQPAQNSATPSPAVGAEAFNTGHADATPTNRRRNLSTGAIAAEAPTQ